jgi:hypothetical protein
MLMTISPLSLRKSNTIPLSIITTIIIIQFNFQFNSIYLCAKLNSPKANYNVSTGKKMGRVRSKKVSENNVSIKIKIIKY